MIPGSLKAVRRSVAMTNINNRQVTTGMAAVNCGINRRQLKHREQTSTTLWKRYGKLNIQVIHLAKHVNIVKKQRNFIYIFNMPKNKDECWAEPTTGVAYDWRFGESSKMPAACWLMGCSNNNNNNLICIAPECQRLLRRWWTESAKKN